MIQISAKNQQDLLCFFCKSNMDCSPDMFFPPHKLEWFNFCLRIEGNSWKSELDILNSRGSCQTHPFTVVSCLQLECVSSWVIKEQNRGALVQTIFLLLLPEFSASPCTAWRRLWSAREHYSSNVLIHCLYSWHFSVINWKICKWCCLSNHQTYWQH